MSDVTALAAARTGFRSLLGPVWPPMAAPLERVEESRPGHVSFFLRFFDWDVRLDVGVRHHDGSNGSRLSGDSAILVDGWIRPRGRSGKALRVVGALAARDFDRRSADGWSLFAEERIAVPWSAADAERALFSIKGRLYRVPDINAYLNRTIARR